MPTPLEQAFAYFKAGDSEKAKQLLAEILKRNSNDVNAWLLMSWCVADAEQKKYCLDRVLKINPQNQHAIEGLKKLDYAVSPNSPPQPKVVRQPAPQHKTQKNYPLIIVLAVIGLLGFVGVCGIVWLVFLAPANLRNLNQQNNPVPTQAVQIARPERPDYERMLEASGLLYYMDDEEGDPIYVSPCGLVVTVKPEYMGFAAKYDPDNDCAIGDLGAIIKIMYPAEVLDFIVSKMNSVIVKDTTVHGTAAGYDINIDFDPYDPKLILTIEDPH